MIGERYPRFVRDLLRPEAYPHAAEDIRIEETHVSWVILAGSYAYKIKKPLDLEFLDFSTLERRTAACDVEVALNRRLAPSTYLGVVDVVERDGRASIGGPGRLVDRAVWMRRLPTDGMLPALLSRDEVSPNLVQRIARLVARFHRSAATGPGVDEHGTAETISALWRQNFEQVAPFVGTTIPAWQVRAVRASVEATLRHDRALFERRLAEGRIRDGHGDLHAASICVADGEIIPFDALEFSPRYRCADVASEVAFLAMDLDHAGRADLGWTFTSAYVRASGDRELLKLLDFYKAYRAFVRGKVRCFRLLQSGLGAMERISIEAEARSYFDLAAAYVAAFPRPILIVTAGVPASGKTTLARSLAGRLGMVYLSTDVTRKRLAGLSPTDRREAPFGAGLYSHGATRRTYATLRRRALVWLRRGLSVVLDGTFGDPQQRRLAREMANCVGAQFLLVLTTSDEATLRRRIEARAQDPDRVSDATWPVAKRVARLFVPIDEVSPSERLVDATGGGGAGAVVELLARRAGSIIDAGDSSG